MKLVLENELLPVAEAPVEEFVLVDVPLLRPPRELVGDDPVGRDEVSWGELKSILNDLDRRRETRDANPATSPA